MLRIMLFCAGGMSTSFLVQNMRKAAVNRGIEAEITASGELELYQKLNLIDVVMLAPQARFAEGKFRKLCKENQKRFALIDPMTYGKMDGNAALDLALAAKLE